MLQQPMKENFMLSAQGIIMTWSIRNRTKRRGRLSFPTAWRSSSISSGTGVRTRPHQGESCCSLAGTACVENIDYRAERGISNRSVIRALAQESSWVANHCCRHLRAGSYTGVGKSYVASALAQKACRDGYRVYYTRAAALFRDRGKEHGADRSSLQQLLASTNRIDVLVIDDWAMT